MQDTMDAGKGKRLAMIVGGLVLAVAAGYGLILLAQGSSYTLTVQDPAQGPENAPVVIEEFADFQCPACKTAATAVEQIIKAYPTQVRVVYKDFPIPGHQNERTAAAAALCSAQQGKFFVFYDKLFTQQDDWATMDAAALNTFLQAQASSKEADLNMNDFNACRNSRDAKRAVENDAQEGEKRSVTSTPTFFINGVKKEGGQSFFQWTQLINAELDKKGLKPETAPAAPAAPIVAPTPVK